MTLAEVLEKTGVHLGQKLGFIIESLDSQGTWTANYARIGMVKTEVPAAAAKQEEVQDFDPEFDIMICWQAGNNKRVYILRMTNNSSLYTLDVGGILIANEDVRIFISQSDFFMQTVCDKMCALAN